MKILYIVTQSDFGGAQRSTLLLAQHFKGEVAAGGNKSELETEANKLSVPFHRLKYLRRGINPIYDILALFEIFYLIRRAKPDIVHLNSSKAGFIGSIAGKLAWKKVVFTARGFVFNEPHSWAVKRFLILLEKFASLFRDRIITVSTADELSAKKYKIINPKKIITIHNAIPKISFMPKEEARKTLGLSPDKFVIGTIANFYPTKGLDVLLEAIKNLDGGIQTVIIGSGPQESALKSIIADLKPHQVVLAGQISHAASLLPAFDLFVLPSRKEGFPLVLLEAIQAGLPIVATDVGGNKEVLGQAGIIVPSEDPDSLTKALVSLISNPNLRTKLSQAGLSQSKNFAPDKLFSETRQIYEILMQST